MPEHLRALVYLLAMAIVVFAFSRAPATALAIEPADFARRRNLWFAVTLVAFLSGNFWIYILLSAVILLVTVQAERNQLALFLGLLFAVPPVSAAVGGFGLLEQFFPINHVRLLALTVLLPAFIVLATRPDRLRFGSVWPDRFLLGYLAVSFGVSLLTTTFTNTLRLHVFVAFLDIVLPYYVASRGLRDLKAFRDALMMLVVAVLVLATLAMFEKVRGWLLYSALIGALDVRWGLEAYQGRGNFGLRAQGSTGHAIALGFVLSVALGVAMYTRSLVPTTRMRKLGIALLIGGLLASLSRGPWLGALATVLAFVALGPGAGRQMAKYATVALAVFLAAYATPVGRDLIDLLPFIGTMEAGNIDYRRTLIDVAFDAIWASPWFGGIDIYASEGGGLLIQNYAGGPFIDVVNTYVGIMLATGLVGLSLFLGFLFTTCASVFRATKQVVDAGDETSLLGRSLLATLIGIMVTILTTSSISFIPTLYWCMAGMGVAFARFVAEANRVPSNTVSPEVGAGRRSLAPHAAARR